MPLDLENISGLVPHQVEQVILRLRAAIEDLQDQNVALRNQIGAIPAPVAPLTIEEIRDALSATGPAPLPTAGLLNTEPPPTSPVQPVPLPPGTEAQTAWAAICADGTRVSCVGAQTQGTPTLQFGSDAPILLPEYGGYLHAVSGGFGHLAIVKGASSGQAILVNRNGTITMLGQSYGQYPVGLRTDGTPVWQESATSYSVNGVSTPIPAPYVDTTNGFLQLDGAGDPVWQDQQLATPVVIDGVTFLQSTTDGNWTVGKSANGVQYIAYNSSTATMYVIGATEGSSIALRLAQQADGSAVVARSYPPGWFSSTAFAPYNLPSGGGTDAIDITTVTFVDSAPTPNPSGWTKTATLNSPAHTGTDVSTPYDKSAIWPGVGPGSVYQANQWLFAFISGQWYAGCAATLTPVGDVVGDYSGPVGTTYFAGTFLETWNPAPGDSVGVMVTPPAKLGQWGAAERSNIVLITW